MTAEGRFDKSRAPGPAPWYLPTFPDVESTSETGLTWSRAKFGDNPEEAIALNNANGRPLVVVGIYSYAYAVNSEALLLWRAHQQGDAAARISFHLLKLSALTPISDMKEAGEQTKLNGPGIYYESTPRDLWSCLADFPAGESKISSPPAFGECGEILVLADRGQAAGADPINSAVLAFDFGNQKVTCFPQDWFNQSNADFGYQWITRVWRDTKGRLCGDGIRLGPFRLDASGRRRDDRVFAWP